MIRYMKRALILAMSFIPMLAVSQLRSVAMVLKLETTEGNTPSLFYMLNDTIIYDLGTGENGIYDICIPGKKVNSHAAFAIQSEDKWLKIATLEQLETNDVCRNGIFSLFLLEIERITRESPENPKELKSPPRPYQPSLLLNDCFFDEDPFPHAKHLIMVAFSANDSLYCSHLLPKQAFDSTYFINYPYLTHPQATSLEKTMDCLNTEFCEYYLKCKHKENLELTIFSMAIIVDETGIIRGAFCFVEKSQNEQGKNLAMKILKHFKDERFSPAINIETGETVPDILEFLIPNCNYTTLDK